MRFTRLAVVAATATMLVGAGALAAPANAAHSTPRPVPAKASPVYGTTTVTTDPGIANALLGKGLVVLATSPGSTSVIGSLSNPRLNINFPVTGINLGRGVIDHKGTLVILNPSKGKSVTLGDLRINLKAGTIAGKLNGGAYVPALKIDASKAKVTNTRAFSRTSGVVVTLNKGIGGVLNGALETDVFAEGLRLGLASVTVKR